MGATSDTHDGAASAPCKPATVRDILELPAMVAAEIVAGRSGLDREVTGANIVEVPDVYRWLGGGEILFTSGYAWREQTEKLVDVLYQLDRIGVSALGVKLGRYLRDVPIEVITAADELGLPLIKIPPDLPYREVIEPLYRRLTSDRLWLLERTTRAQEVFAPLGLDDQSIEKVASALADEVRNPVYVLDMVDDSAVLAYPHAPAKRFQVGEIDGENANIIRTIEELTLTRTPMPVRLTDGALLGASLVVGRRSLGRIAVLEKDAPLDEFVEVAMAHGGELISFLLMQRMAILEGRREAGDLFFDSLMSDQLTNEEAAERALTLGLRLTRPCVAVTVGATSGDERTAELLRLAVERAVYSLPHVMGKGMNGADLLVVLETDEHFEQHGLKEMMQRIALLARRDALGDVLVGAGSIRTGLAGVRRSRSEALIAFQFAARMGKSGLVCFDDLKVERVLAQIPKNEVSNDYITMMLGPLEDEPQLLKTLETFLEHGGNKVATAAAIPMHRSSLAYRLDKIATLLSVSVDDPETQLELWLALRLRRLFRLTGHPSSRPVV